VIMLFTNRVSDVKGRKFVVKLVSSTALTVVRNKFLLMPPCDTVPNVEEGKVITILLGNRVPIAEQREYMES
jgi:hypothetical protein